tara:strand:+ start:1304 stop:1573 length:270 start_codon:yes stop_codon:yes gene_type:complete
MAKFPDLNKDGKVTQADILMGRGVKLSNGGRIVYRATGNPRQDETKPINLEHSKATIELNEERMEDATKLGDGVSIRGGHINYIDDNDD